MKATTTLSRNRKPPALLVIALAAMQWARMRKSGTAQPALNAA